MISSKQNLLLGVQTGNLNFPHKLRLDGHGPSNVVAARDHKVLINQHSVARTMNLISTTKLSDICRDRAGSLIGDRRTPHIYSYLALLYNCSRRGSSIL